MVDIQPSNVPLTEPPPPKKTQTFQDYYYPVDTLQRLKLSWKPNINKAEQSSKHFSRPEKKTLPEFNAI